MDKIFKSDKIIESVEKKSEASGKSKVSQLRFLVFSLGDKFFAVSGLHAKEVNAIDKIFFFPHVDPWLRGLVNIRGDVHSIIDLKEILNIENVVEEKMQMVYTSEMVTTSIAIDDIIDVVDVPVDSIVYYNEEDTARQYIAGIIEYKDSEVLIIDIDEIMKEFVKKIDMIKR